MLLLHKGNWPWPWGIWNFFAMNLELLLVSFISILSKCTGDVMDFVCPFSIYWNTLWIKTITCKWNVVCSVVCLFVCLKPHKALFSNMAAVTITGDGAAYLDICLPRMAFRSEGSLTCHTCCDTELQLYGSIRRTAPHVPQWDFNPWRKNN
jgi:hypothetical protein